jgi:hypothetical protein
MRPRSSVPVLATLITFIASVSFAIGSYNAQRETARQMAEGQAKIDALRVEMIRALTLMKSSTPTGTAGRVLPDGTLAQHEPETQVVIDAVKRQLENEMGLLPLQLLKARRESFVELYSYDNFGASNYGTAGYLGRGYFITVKHGVLALNKDADERREQRRVVSIKIVYKGKSIPATLVDAGDANVEVDRGDWAIIRVNEKLDMPPLRVDLDFAYDFADPIFRLGNDYSKGIILSTGYVGQRTSNGLVTCLTDGHPGVSGGGVLDRQGDLVGIPIGRMQGDYRFSFILPLRQEMFRKVPSLLHAEAEIAD